MTSRWSQRLCGGLVILAFGVGYAAAPEPQVVELFSGINFSPNWNGIEQVFGNTAMSDLVALAEDLSAEADEGLRLRAYRALGEYPDDDPEQILIGRTALESAIARYKDSIAGLDLLYLRASMLSLSRLAGGESLSHLLPLLSHPNRDVRAACAQSLALAGDPAAAQALRDQALVEEIAQVQIAIDDALFELENFP